MVGGKGLIENLLFSAGGGFAIGALAGYALKHILKLAAIILGVFFLGLTYLAYRGWIHPDWHTIQSQTQSGILNATHMATQYIQSTAAQLSHQNVIHVQGMTVTAGVAFIPGLIFGLKH